MAVNAEKMPQFLYFLIKEVKSGYMQLVKCNKVYFAYPLARHCFTDAQLTLSNDFVKLDVDFYVISNKILT